MIRVLNRLPVASFIVLVAVSCGSSETPEEVARAFWEAMRVEDRDQAATFVTEGGLSLLNEGSFPETMEQVLLGEALRSESAAMIRTSMRTRAEEVDFNIVFQTHLVLEEGEWKIDLVATHEEVNRASFTAGMKFMSEAIGQGIKEFGHALEEGAADVRDAIREAIDDLGEAREDAR